MKERQRRGLARMQCVAATVSECVCADTSGCACAAPGEQSEKSRPLALLEGASKVSLLSLTPTPRAPAPFRSPTLHNIPTLAVTCRLIELQA